MRYINFLNKDDKVIETLDISGRYRVSRCIEIGLEDGLQRNFFVSEGENKETAIAVTDKIVHSDFSEYVDNMGNLIKNIKDETMETKVEVKNVQNAEVIVNVQYALEAITLSVKKAMVEVVSMIDDRQDAIVNGDTLKKVKADTHECLRHIVDLPEGLVNDINLLDSVRTKVDYSNGLSAIAAKANNCIDTLTKQLEKIEEKKLKAELVTKVKEETKPGLTKENITKLSELAGLVQHSIQVATNAHMNAGEYLNEGLILHKNAGLSSKEWEKWAGLACQVKRAQAYNLVKIWNQFGANSDFSGCSMRVLNLLVHLKKEDFDKIEQDAKSLAKVNKLDTKAVNSLIERIKPAKSEPVKEVPVKEEIVKEEPDLITKTLTNVINTNTINQDTPVIDKDSTEQVTGEGITMEAPAKVEQDDKDKLIAELREQNLQLLAQIAELTKAVKESKPEPKVLHLPQFDESEPYLVLGINPCAGKEEILKRYRSMAVIFNAKTCPTGAIALKNAKDSLIANCK